MRNRSVGVLFLFSSVLGFVALEQNTRASDNNLKPDRTSEIQPHVTPPDDAYPPGRDWPIVHQETREYVDRNTRVRHAVTTVIREMAAPADKMEVGPCQEIFGVIASEATPDAAPLGTCTYEGQVSRSDVDTISYSGQKLRHTLVSIAAKYTGNNSTYYKLTKLKNFWWRSSTAWTVQGANHEWGCHTECEKCDGTTYTGWSSGSVGTPAWYDDHNTWVYVSTPATTFPALKAEGEMVIPVRPFAHAWSDGYHSGVKRGTMEVGIEW